MRIGIVNDMPMAVEALRRVLLLSENHQIIWTAENGQVAVSRAAENPPDLILMDLIMPVMDGVEATRKIMQSSPCNILVVTASVSSCSGKVFEAIGAGALDVVATPVLGMTGEKNGAHDLLQKIDRIEKISQVIPRPRPVTSVKPAKNVVPAKRKKQCLIAIGSSTGGPHALLRILSCFPADFSASIVVVQHMDKQFTEGLAIWLNGQIDLQVKVIEKGDRPQAGTVLIPSTDGHLVMNPDNRLGYSIEPRDNYYHPSVDVFLNSIVEHWHGNCIGIILTGMGRDGAEGMLALKKHDHYSIAQDRQSSVVFGMPKAAVEAGGICEVLPVKVIGSRIIELLHSGTQKCHHD